MLAPHGLWEWTETAGRKNTAARCTSTQSLTKYWREEKLSLKIYRLTRPKGEEQADRVDPQNSNQNGWAGWSVVYRAKTDNLSPWGRLYRGRHRWKKSGLLEVKSTGTREWSGRKWQKFQSKTGSSGVDHHNCNGITKFRHNYLHINLLLWVSHKHFCTFFTKIS